MVSASHTSLIYSTSCLCLFHLTHEDQAAQRPSGLPKVTEVTARPGTPNLWLQSPALTHLL